MKKLNKRGFTLIEILVVVAIIGILAGVVLISLRSTGPTARDSRRLSELKSVQNGLELFFNKEGRYPDATNWTELTDDLTGANIGITRVPNDPTSGATYEYATDTGGTTYVLKATLEIGGSTLTDGDLDVDTLGLDCDAVNGEGEEIAYCTQL
mgnify:CR=1 FL=1